MSNQLQKVLEELDRRNDTITEMTVLTEIETVVQYYETQKLDRPDELTAEWIAFNVVPDYKNGDGPWGTYFGPMMVWGHVNDKIVTVPSIEQITSTVIDYWEGRAAEAANPLLRCRYADLVWEFKPKIASQRGKVDFAWIVIDSTLQIIKQLKFDSFLDAERKLERALALALSLKDQARLAAVRDAILNLNETLDDPQEKRHAAVFALQQLVGQKKIALGQQEEQAIIQKLEAYLEESSGGADNSGSKVPEASEVFASLLADYYRSKGRPEDVRRVLILYGSTVEAVSHSQPAIQAATWLHRVHGIYMDFGLKADSEAMLVSLERVSRNIKRDLQLIKIKVDIDPAQLEQFLESVTQGTLDDVLEGIAIHFIPDPAQAERTVKELAKKSIFRTLIPQQILGEGSRVVAQVGTVKDDLDGNVVLQLSQNMKFGKQMLAMVLAKVKERHGLSADQLLAFVSLSPVYNSDRHIMLKSGLDAYMREDWISAIHLFIPQIEQALRQSSVLLRRPIMKTHRGGGFVLKNLDEILRDDAVEQWLTSPVTKYLRTLLCDQRGWNVRNNVCHGILPAEGFNWMVADRLLHVILLLGLLRIQQAPIMEEVEQTP